MTDEDKNEPVENPETPETPPASATPTPEGVHTPDTSATSDTSATPDSPTTPPTPEDSPTGEVVTGPIDQNRIQPRPPAHARPDPATHAYSQTNPSTKQMETPGTGEFGPIGTDPSLPASSPDVPVTRSAPAAGKHGRRRTYGLVAVAVVLLLVIAGVGTELYMRNKVTSCIENAFGDLTGASTEVSVSRKPMLLSVFGSSVPWVQVDTSDGEPTDMRLHARAEGISTDGGTVDHLDGTGYLPYKRITELSNDSGTQGGAKITDIAADDKAGTIKISTEVPIAIISVPATVTLKPKLTNGAVDFQVTDATALMFGLPSDFAQPIVDQVTDSMFGPLFKQIKVDEFTVTKTGINFSFAGDDVNMKEAAESPDSSGESSGGCSI
ncbi:LmeA family phospholipid-binding protein [Gordonia liuliyuniae]|uniref:DUF2993 domain-containing protein n=1 Tax=Gordonia liuliyuniae TaxID=2911517 RepID=A0ABS9ISM4_9ACTN|nr:LmeA family phospholipid-binding protein [Gordonia liuliyuniae]MCF8588563.1 DUF2993 domain-containing protein [Gordonia liuliyuniae]